MDQVHEIIILEIENVRITNVRAFIGWKTYEIADIRSVSLTEMNQSPASSKALVAISLVSLVIGIPFCVASLSIPFITILQEFSGLPRIYAHLLFAVIELLFILGPLVGTRINLHTSFKWKPHSAYRPL